MHPAVVKISHGTRSNKSRDYHDIIDAPVKHSVLSYHLVRLQFSVRWKVSEGYVIILSAIPLLSLSLSLYRESSGRGVRNEKKGRGAEKRRGGGGKKGKEKDAAGGGGGRWLLY